MRVSIVQAIVALAAGWVGVLACSSNSNQSSTATGGDDGSASGSGTTGAGSGSTGGTTTSGSGGSSSSSSGTNSSGGANSDAGDASVDSGPPPLVNPAPGGKLFVGVNFWRIEWEGATDYFLPGVSFATVTDPWQPALFPDLTPFHVVRFMDWNATNDASNPQANWSTRKQKSGDQTVAPVAFEWQIDLCNRGHTDYWLNIPSQADLTDYPQNLAQLVFDLLDPSLRVYVEWSNEVWNGGFPQNAYASQQATNLNLPGTAFAAYQVYASVRVWEQFEAVFGKGSPRLVKVLAGQAAWNGPCTDLMAALPNTTINPNATKPDVFAVAPYFSGNSISDLQSAIPGLVAGLQQNATCAMGAGLPLIAYEGGADSFSAPNNGCETLQTDPGMQGLYTSFLDMLSTNIKGPLNQYTESGACWGLKVKTGDPVSMAPKYAGVTDWLAAHP
jgi:hypothetical protein